MVSAPDPPIKLNWAQRQRMVFIRTQLVIAGRVNRSDLMREFSISTPQASADFRRFQQLFPEAMRYDTSAKAYVATTKEPADG